MKKASIHLLNLLTNNLFTLGILGKPHALHGYLYLNHDIYFRQFDLTGLHVFINGNAYEIEDFKKHLKERYLIKLKGLNSISDIEIFRNKNIYITSYQVTSYVAENLPWPGFFVDSKINSQYFVKDYFYADKLIFLTLKDTEEIVVPYNTNFFSYENEELQLINFDLA